MESLTNRMDQEEDRMFELEDKMNNLDHTIKDNGILIRSKFKTTGIKEQDFRSKSIENAFNTIKEKVSPN